MSIRRYPAVNITGNVEVNLNDSNGNPILSTIDPYSGKNGIDVNLLESGIIGDVGQPLSSPYQDAAMAIAFNNGGTLQVPNMDVADGTLIIDATQKGNVPVKLTASDINLPVSVQSYQGVGGQQTMASSFPVVLASDQSAVPITVPGTLPVSVTNLQSDVLGVAITGQKNNQVEIDFNTVPASGLLTQTLTNGGTITASGGQTTFASGGTAGAASARGVSVASVNYRPGNETYAQFSAGFFNWTTGGFQRIGLYDSTNGFFLGFQGSTFGVTKRTAGVDSFTNQFSFNVDTLSGASNSKFTRNGVPEAIVFNFSNLFRIRFAWLGSASIYFDVFSPDGAWVNFHVIRQPNTQALPSLTNPNLPMTAEAGRTAGSVNVQLYTACWAAGSTSSAVPLTSTITDNTLATVGRTVIEGKTTGGGGGYVPVKVNPSGSLVADVSNSTGLGVSSLPSIPAGSNNIGSITNITGTVSLPTGAATAALQTTGNTTLSTISGQLPTTLGAKTTANSMAVNIASDQIVPVAINDLYITGAAAQTTSGNNALLAVAGTGSVDANGYRSGYVQVVSTATAGNYIFECSQDNTNFQTMLVVNQATINGTVVSSSITATASSLIYAFPITARYIRLRIVTGLTGGSIQCFTRLAQTEYQPISLPVTQATASNLNVSASIAASQTLATVTTVGTVTSITNNVNVKQVNSVGTFVRNDYTTTNVTTGAYVQLIASTAAAYNAIEIFDSSGQTLQLAIGASGSEVNQFLIFPGGNGRIPFTIASGSRVSVRAVSGTANVGELDINFYV